MLKKAATEEGKDWDKLVPYFCLPTERSLKPLLDFRLLNYSMEEMYEDHWTSWESSQKSDDSIISYVLSTHEKLLKMSEVVQENLSKAQSPGMTKRQRVNQSGPAANFHQ